jgi:hypothetical protein
VQNIHFRHTHQSQRPAQPTAASHALPMRRSPRGFTSLQLPWMVSPLLLVGVARTRLLPLVPVFPFISNLQRSVWLPLRR